MKLLLTSGGFTNDKIIAGLEEMLAKPISKSSLAFIPTAAAVELGDKSWLINDLNTCKKLGFKTIDIVDIAALSSDMIHPRLEAADVFLFEGGNAYFLMYCLQKSGVKDFLPNLLQTRVYVGISAGSMVTTTNFYPTFNHDVGLYDEKILNEKYIKYGLSFVDFHVIPHLNAKIFPKVRLHKIEEYAAKTSDPIYAIDDQTAIQVHDKKISVISEGIWEKFN